MSKPRMVAALLVMLVVLGTGATFPQIRRLSRQSDLEVAASSFCACMLGRHTGNVKQALDGVELALALEPPGPGRAWPQRCKPFAQPAVSAMFAAWRSSVPGAMDDSWGEIDEEIGKGNARYAAAFLDALQHFWVNEPAPNVPVAPAPVFVRSAADTRPFIEASIAVFDVSVDRGTAKLDFFGGTRCTVDPERHSSCISQPGDLVPPEPNLAVTIVQSRSTRFVDGWAIWKNVGPQGRFDVPADLMVMNLAEGAKAKPQSLGTVERPHGYAFARTYGVCRDDTLWVDMDPNLAVFRNGVWAMVKMEQPLNGRHIDCRGDVAYITDWDPPSVRRCDADGCVMLPLPPISGTAEDELACDGEAVYQLQRIGAALVLVIRPLHGGPVRRVALIEASTVAPINGNLDRGALHLHRGKVLITLIRKADSEAIVLAVDPDGTTRVLVAGE